MHLHRFSERAENLRILVHECAQLELDLVSYLEYSHNRCPNIQTFSNVVVSTLLHLPVSPIATRNVPPNSPNQLQSLQNLLQLTLNMVSGPFSATKGL